MRMLKAGIIGASGYTGVELARLLARHSGVGLQFVTSDRPTADIMRDLQAEMMKRVPAK